MLRLSRAPIALAHLGGVHGAERAGLRNAKRTLCSIRNPTHLLTLDARKSRAVGVEGDARLLTHLERVPLADRVLGQIVASHTRLIVILPLAIQHGIDRRHHRLRRHHLTGAAGENTAESRDRRHGDRLRHL